MLDGKLGFKNLKDTFFLIYFTIQTCQALMIVIFQSKISHKARWVRKVVKNSQVLF